MWRARKRRSWQMLLPHMGERPRSTQDSRNASVSRSAAAASIRLASTRAVRPEPPCCLRFQSSMRGEHRLALVHGEYRTFGEHRQVFVGYDRGDFDDEVGVRLQTGHLKIDPNEILGRFHRVVERAKPHGSRAATLKEQHGSGIVLASYGRGVLVQSQARTVHCALKGRKQRIVCGDRVTWASAPVGRRRRRSSRSSRAATWSSASMRAAAPSRLPPTSTGWPSWSRRSRPRTGSWSTATGPARTSRTSRRC